MAVAPQRRGRAKDPAAPDHPVFGYSLLGGLLVLGGQDYFVATGLLLVAAATLMGAWHRICPCGDSAVRRYPASIPVELPMTQPPRFWPVRREGPIDSRDSAGVSRSQAVRVSVSRSDGENLPEFLPPDGQLGG
jgi:hypothetical protein